MTTVRCPDCFWTGTRKSDPPDAKPCPNGHRVKVGPWPPTSVETTPSGIEISFYDSENIESGQPQTRRYLVDGKRLTSVTTITGCLDKSDALIPWAVNLAKQGIDWRDVRDEAGERGTSAHDVALAVILGQARRLSSMEEAHRPYGQAAMRWVSERRPKLIAAECMVASVEHGFAGRFDVHARIDGPSVRADFKTVTEFKYRDGKRLRPFPENVLQLDLYEAAARESGYESADYGMVVRLGPDGTYDETPFELNPERGLRILGAYRARAEASKALSAGLPDLAVVA